MQASHMKQTLLTAPNDVLQTVLNFYSQPSIDLSCNRLHVDCQETSLFAALSLVRMPLDS